MYINIYHTTCIENLTIWLRWWPWRGAGETWFWVSQVRHILPDHLLQVYRVDDMPHMNFLWRRCMLGRFAWKVSFRLDEKQYNYIYILQLRRINIIMTARQYYYHYCYYHCYHYYYHYRCYCWFMHKAHGEQSRWRHTQHTAAERM